MAEAHGQDSQTVRRLYCAEISNVFAITRGRLKVRYETSVIAVCRQKAPAPSTVFNCVRDVKCGKDTAQ
jgi:hypothetical protein